MARRNGRLRRRVREHFNEFISITDSIIDGLTKSEAKDKLISEGYRVKYSGNKYGFYVIK